jgi:hypothetical protein
MLNIPLYKLTPYAIILSLAIMSFPLRVHADSSQVQNNGAPQRAAGERSATTTRQYNDRLPPVMPGEEIVTETGQKIKTWSSSGPVPVNRRQEPQMGAGNPQAGGGWVGNGVGVIVDGRELQGGKGGR